jgi:protease IV
MKGFLRFIGVVVATCALLVVVTITFKVITKTWFGKSSSRAGHIAVVDLKGMITSSDTFVHRMKDSEEDPHVKGILVRINSPGGMVAPSQEMLQAIAKADKVKPVFASMGAVAASGGYYAAVGARKIYANPGTLTASVGVIAEFVNTEKLFKWAKIDRFTLKSGKMKDVGSPVREMTKEEREFLQGMLKSIHTEFQTTVKTHRKLSDEAVEKYLDGRVMTGTQALETKLVDALGGFEDAAVELREVAGLPKDADLIEFEEPEGLLRKLLWGEAEESRYQGLADFAALWQKEKASLLQALPLHQGYAILTLAPVITQ